MAAKFQGMEIAMILLVSRIYGLSGLASFMNVAEDRHLELEKAQ